jgi:alanyl-tRNA synthetase
MPSANEVRRQFIDFFVQKHGHTFVPSSSVVPLDDPTLMFTNAGMNQFKDVFLGTGTRDYKRAANSQKCIRVSGKHNDLEEVGRDTYHHTFFEMLGNWSFGDYYKREAIRWAWELLTDVWKLDKTRLHATVFGGDNEVEADQEALELWRSETDIDPAHIHRFGKKDNFWMMGETGPCGPCSEIHYDRTPAKEGGKLVNAGDARVMEIWNLVFIQYNRDPAGRLGLLPAKHVDTGMGFERITAILQDKLSNYDTDVFLPIIQAISACTNQIYHGSLDNGVDIAFRVVADHLRMLTFAITDGALPDNKGRGSVIRSIIRRAVRFGWRWFEQREPFVYKLVPVLVHQMGHAYAELSHNPERVAEIIRGEEADFLRTIERGLALYERVKTAVRDFHIHVSPWQKQTAERLLPTMQAVWAQHAAKGLKSFDLTSASTDTKSALLALQYRIDFLLQTGIDLTAEGMARWYTVQEATRPAIPGEAVFQLHSTYGFPSDLTRQMAVEDGMLADMKRHLELMREHEEKSRTYQASGALSISGSASAILWKATDDHEKLTQTRGQGKVLGWLENAMPVYEGRLTSSRPTALILDQTCFYAESGGQVGDAGSIITPTGTFKVETTTREPGSRTILHHGALVDGFIEAGQVADLAVSAEREFTRKNHTATHLLHWALQRVLGSHVEQRGSKVKPDEFTFDFSHPAPMTEQEKNEVERLVNEKIYDDLPVQARELPIAEARKLPGVRAFFGDKYGDVVRVIEIGDGFSREFCGGTHLTHTGQAGFFKIVAEEGVAKGVRRLTCVTARQAVAAVQEHEHVLTELTTRFRCRPEELPARLDGLQEEIKKLEQQIKKGASADLAGAADRLLAAATEVNGARVVIGEMPGGDLETLRQQVDRLRQKAGSAVVVIGWTTDGRVQLLAGVTDDLVKRGLHAGKLVSEIAKVVGGSGGGKPSMAQAGGKDPARLGEALELARLLAGQEISR